MPWNETHVCIITSGPGILSPVAGCQLSGGRSKVGSNYFPRKIGTGMPHILGFLERGCRFFCDTGNGMEVWA